MNYIKYNTTCNNSVTLDVSTLFKYRDDIITKVKRKFYKYELEDLYNDFVISFHSKNKMITGSEFKIYNYIKTSFVNFILKDFERSERDFDTISIDMSFSSDDETLQLSDIITDEESTVDEIEQFKLFALADSLLYYIIVTKKDIQLANYTKLLLKVYSNSDRSTKIHEQLKDYFTRSEINSLSKRLYLLIKSLRPIYLEHKDISKLIEYLYQNEK